MNSKPSTSIETIDSGIPEATLQAIAKALIGLRYGQVTVIVQDGKVMQIDRTDRFRLPASETVTTGASRHG